VTAVYDGTAFQLSGRVRSWDFVDTPQAFPGSAAALTRPHGLGFMPTKVRVVVVQTNASAQNGYAQNDEVAIEHLQVDGNSNQAFAIAADATNVTVAQVNNAQIAIIPKTGGAHASMTETNWNIKVYASL